MASNHAPQRTPFYAAHRALGATMTEFAGWEMPLQYSGVVAEHLAVRRAVGVFDISHMGVLLVAGPNAQAVLNALLTNDVAQLQSGHAQYTFICNERGGVVDDLILYRIEPSMFLLVVNAINTEKDFNWIAAHATQPVVLENRTTQTAALALQGPAAARVLPEAAGLSRFQIARFTLAGCTGWTARTGYTGEDGFELFFDAADAEKVWRELLERGKPFGLVPAGLGARDSLRLEMCYPLYGHELDENTTPVEAGLSQFVAFDKGPFIGQPALLQQRKNGVSRRLIAFAMDYKGPLPRTQCKIFAGGQPVGTVTSGSYSPMLEVGIGLGYAEPAVAAIGTQIQVEIRGRLYPAKVKPRPLVKKHK